MAKQKQSGGEVVIRLDSRLFYGLVGGVAFLLLLFVAFYAGLKLAQPNQPSTAAAQQSSFQPPGIQPQSNNPIQVQPGQQPSVRQQLPPGQAEQAPFNQPAVRQVRRPAGDEVPVGDNPRLALPELAETNYVHDFGKVPPDEIVETTVKVENKGAKPLVIKSVRGSCGCTVANTGEDTVPPGESTDLRVTYDPTYNNDAGKQITRQVIVESNDPAAPVVEFTIRADVQSQ